MNTTLKIKILETMPILSAGALMLPFTLLASPLQAQAASTSPTTTIPKADQNVRIMRNEDGSYTEFRRSADERVIEKRTYGDRVGGSGDRVLRMSVIYRKDVHGKLRSGRVHDGSGKILYRVVYGYHKQTGRLVAEDMFDARVKRTKPFKNAQGQLEEREVPVRRLYHRYDAQGRPAKPIVFCAPAGKTAEKLFGREGSTYLRDDPFSKGGRTINPNARPTR